MCCLIALTACAESARGEAKQPATSPAAPAGFTWKRFDPARTSFLVPDGWHVLSESSNGTDAVFITKEEIRPGGTFVTGVTINVVTRNKKTDVAALGAAMIKEMRKKGEVLESVDDVKHGPLTGSSCTVALAAPNDNLITYVAALADTSANRLYIVQFEAPKAEWTNAWRIGKVVAEQFRVDPK